LHKNTDPIFLYYYLKHASEGELKFNLEKNTTVCPNKVWYLHFIKISNNGE